ncbi:MAG TPA: DNA ligase D [Thermoanaerobaculia bacterium]|nr:DNA ligase D [Thermoanaerobaculia bacterium]
MSPRPRKNPRGEPAGPAASLEPYRAKREADATPEPFGAGVRRPKVTTGTPGLFVMQKHAARRTHYDLRLELGGVLKSWAVPHGPSLDPSVKRLAVETEDHPIEYGEFEGVIPEGNYGAGSMIVWDRGTWVPLEEPAEGMAKGKLLFELRGYKLRGVWTLFLTRPTAIHRGRKDLQGQWLLVKKPDAAARETEGDDDGVGATGLAEESVLSGLTVDELADGAACFDPVRERLDELDAPCRPVDPQRLALMLAQPADEPFTRKDWLFELKVDGYRLIAAKTAGKPYLRYRNGHDAAALYPEVTRALRALPVGDLVLDGEIAVLDAEGRPSFSHLQQRALLSRPLDIERAALHLPATFFAFDLLAFDGRDLRGLRLLERKELLGLVAPRLGPLRCGDFVEEIGEVFYQQVERLGFEGVVAKRADSPYVGRRSGDWLKLRVDRTGSFVIVGTSAAKGQRTGFGALHVAVVAPPDDNAPDAARNDLVYAGRVGTGFSERLLADLDSRLAPLARDTPPCRAPAGGELPRGKGHRWVEPELCCEVRFKESTPQGMLRHPVFLRLRDDLEAEDCARQQAPAHDDAPEAALASPPVPPAPRATSAPRVQLTNLEKVFWPQERYTKGDLVEYYRAIAPAMLPYLARRPIVLTRYPDGIDGKSFFQKNAPDFAPDWIETVTIWSEGSERDIEYFVVESPEALAYLANLATIPIHMWSSRLDSLERPDWCVIDLDPKEAPFEHVVEIARAIHRLCEQIALPSFVKTSGSSGLHVLLPLAGACTWEQSRTLGMLIAQVISRQLPKIATIVRSPRKREGKVYLDYVQNGHGRLIVAPYCVRPLPGAPVSAPLRWSEVTPKLELGKFTIESMPVRVARQKRDPMLRVLEESPDLVSALARLTELI